jgi:WD40 repeat protein
VRAPTRQSGTTRIRHYISSLGVSGGHKKLVLKGEAPPKRGTGGGGVGGKAGAGDASRERNVVLQRREQRKEAKQQTMLDIMMLLDTNHLSDIRKEFMDAEDGLELLSFVKAMLKYLSKDNVDENHLVASLCELFAQVDVNGDATMEWDEFYEYIHEQGMAEPDMEKASMMKYNPRPLWEDRTLPKRVDCMTYYDMTDWVGIAEHNSVHLAVYDIISRKHVHTLTHKAAVLTSLWVDAGGKKYIVVSTCDYALTVWDTQSVWEASGFAIVSNTADGSPMMMAPDSQMSLMWEEETATLYSGGVNGMMHTWDLTSFEAKPHKMQCVRDGNKSSVRAILSVPTLNGVLSGTLDGSMMLWDRMGSKKPRKVYKGHRNGIIAIAYSASLKMIVSAGIRDELLVWNPFVEKKVTELPGHRAAMLGLHLVESAAGAYQLLSADKSGIFKVWDLRSLGCIQTFAADAQLNGIKNYLALSHKNMIIAANNRRFQEFEFSYSNTPDLTDDLPIVCAIYNEVMDTFVTAAGCHVTIWDSNTGHPLKTFSDVSQAPIISLCLDDRQRKFFVGDAKGRITCHNYLNGVEMKEFEPHASEVTALLYVDMDKCLVTASWDRSVCIHDDMDNDEGVVLRTIKGHGKDVTCAACSLSLKLLATSGADGHIMVWNYGLGLLEGMCKGHAQDVTHLAFLDPYPALLSTDILGNVVVWGMPPGPVEHRFKCMLRIKNILLQHVYSVVLDACWFPGVAGFDAKTQRWGRAKHGEDDLVVTGDESGQLKVRSVKSLMQRFKLSALPEPAAPTLQELRLRRRAVTEMPVPPAPNPRQSFQDNARGPGMALADDKREMPVVRQWHAHDCVRAMSAMRSKGELISTGFDHLVRIWTLEGRLLGTLRQGRTILEDWLFQPNAEAKAEALKREASEVMYDLGIGQAPEHLSRYSRGNTAKGELGNEDDAHDAHDIAGYDDGR